MSKTYSIEELREIIGTVARQYGVKKVALFGSYAKGMQNTESDVDLLVDKGEIKGLFKWNGFINTLEDRLQKNVDAVTYAALAASLISDAVEDEVILYEQ